MKCKHKWEAASINGRGGTFSDIKVVSMFVCQKCMSYKEEELKFLKEKGK